jgi:GxxExxY protein
MFWAPVSSKRSMSGLSYTSSNSQASKRNQRSRFVFPTKATRSAIYTADIVVEGQVVVELKCVERLLREHMAQCINYLKASGLRVALLINFQRPRVEWKRIVL